MSVRIILSKTSEPAEKRELFFDGETISLGREPSNILPLPGTQVSKLHARIERQGSNYSIVDLNSTNSTYVNGEKLIAGEQHPLAQGDKVVISDYELEVYPSSTLTSSQADSRPSPPVETRPTTPGVGTGRSQELSGAMGSAGVVERWARLTADIQSALEKFELGDFARTQEELQARCTALDAENQKLKAELAKVRENQEGPSMASDGFARRDDARLEQLIRVLLLLFFKLSSGRTSFLSEFIVRTVIRTSSDLPTQPRSDEERLRYFTDPGLTDDEFSERLTLLRKESDQIVFHMIGLLEGYRRSVEEGTRRILQRVDPDRLEEDLPDTLLYRYIPPLADLRLFSLVRRRLRELLQEDRGVLEKQVFRPGFARAYEDCVEPAPTKV